MFKNELTAYQRQRYNNDSDIFNVKPTVKRPEIYKQMTINQISKESSNTQNKGNNNSITNGKDRANYINNLNKITSSDNHNNNTNSISNNRFSKCQRYKKDLVQDCLIDSTNNNKQFDDKKYIKTNDLKKKSREFQLKDSYKYNYIELTKSYRNNLNKNKAESINFGDDKKMNLCTEYDHMQDYAKRLMSAKKEKNDKLKKFNSINQNRPKTTKEHEQYLTNYKSLSKKRYNNYKSNIFFDKQKDESNKVLEPKVIINTKKNTEKKTNNNSNENKSSLIPNKKYFIKKTDLDPNNDPNNNHLSKTSGAVLRNKGKKINENKKVDNDVFEIVDIDRNNKFDMIELKQEFNKQGLQLYGAVINDNYYDGNAKGKFTFNVRKTNDDKDYDNKVKGLKEYFMKKQGIVLNKKPKMIMNSRPNDKNIGPSTPSNKKSVSGSGNKSDAYKTMMNNRKSLNKGLGKKK